MSIQQKSGGVRLLDFQGKHSISQDAGNPVKNFIHFIFIWIKFHGFLGFLQNHRKSVKFIPSGNVDSIRLRN